MISFKRIIAVAKKETIELFRDPARVVGNIIVPIVLMFLFSSGINIDVKNIPFMVLDYDNTPSSRSYADAYINSQYYAYEGNAYSQQEAELALKQNDIKFYIEIPSGFGRNLMSGKGTQVGSFKIKSRYWYNQAAESKFSFVPGAIAMILIVIPSIMMTLSIVKEKEQGTITNFYATPLTKLEFLIGKQVIYIAIFFIIYLILIGIAVFIYQVPIKGSFLLLSIITLIYIFTTTAMGLFVSSFAKSQIAGLMIALIATMIPSFTYSGLLIPISSLDASGQLMSKIYPVIYYMRTIMGIFAKDLPLQTILPNAFFLILFYIIIMSLSTILLKKQEK